jgi:hypothetical protein
MTGDKANGHAGTTIPGDDCDGSEEDRPSCPGNPESLMAIVDVATRNGHASTPAVIARRRQIA